MDISGIETFDPQDPASVLAFMDANETLHRTINNALLEQGIVLSHFPLFGNEITSDWLMDHAQEHQSLRLIFNLPAVVGLRDLGIKDDSQRQSWLLLHVNAHQAIEQALGLV